MPLPIVPAPTTPTCLICICNRSADLEGTKSVAEWRSKEFSGMKHNARGTRCDTPRGTLRFAGVAPKNTADSKKLRDRVNLDDANLLTVSDTAIPNQSRGITR